MVLCLMKSPTGLIRVQYQPCKVMHPATPCLISKPLKMCKYIYRMATRDGKIHEQIRVC